MLLITKINYMKQKNIYYGSTNFLNLFLNNTLFFSEHDVPIALIGE